MVITISSSVISKAFSASTRHQFDIEVTITLNPSTIRMIRQLVLEKVLAVGFKLQLLLSPFVRSSRATALRGKEDLDGHVLGFSTLEVMKHQGRTRDDFKSRLDRLLVLVTR